MGKTMISLAILYEHPIVELLQGRRFFLSCEALLDANSVVISLAKLLGLPVSGDLLTAVITRLTDMSRYRGVRHLQCCITAVVHFSLSGCATKGCARFIFSRTSRHDGERNGWTTRNKGKRPANCRLSNDAAQFPDQPLVRSQSGTRSFLPARFRLPDTQHLTIVLPNLLTQSQKRCRQQRIPLSTSLLMQPTLSTMPQRRV